MKDTAGKPLAPPPLALAALEGGRVFGEFTALSAAVPFLARCPKGDGHTVIVLPGYSADDASTAPLRAFLRSRGYQVTGWGLGVNRGRASVGANRERLIELVSSAHAQSSGKVSLVGWSLGGVFARDVARLAPQLVRQVVAMGSPIAGDPRATNLWRVNRRRYPGTVNEDEIRDRVAKNRIPPAGVPCTAIYSKSDGLVSWHASLEKTTPLTDNIEIVSSHCGMGLHPAVFFALADRLAQPENDWRPFSRKGWRRFVFAPAKAHQA